MGQGKKTFQKDKKTKDAEGVVKWGVGAETWTGLFLTQTEKAGIAGVKRNEK